MSPLTRILLPLPQELHKRSTREHHLRCRLYVRRLYFLTQHGAMVLSGMQVEALPATQNMHAAPCTGLIAVYAADALSASHLQGQRQPGTDYSLGQLQ